jgi:hypothetical protein
MKLNRPPGGVPELMRPGGLTRRRGRCPSLLGICLLAAVIGGPASVAGAAGPSASIRAAIAGWLRSLSRQRLRVGPMLPTGMPSLALISA